MEFVFKYIPQEFNELILNNALRKQLAQTFVTLPSMFLVGPHGIGKGSFTYVFLKKTGCDYLWINGSDENKIETVREKIKTFAVSIGSTDIKYVIINEAERLSGAAADSLLDQMERVNEITRYIFMANKQMKIPDELLSRGNHYVFSNPPGDEIFKRCCYILDAEHIKYDKKTISEIIKKKYPDIRQTIRTIEQNCIDGNLNSDFILTEVTDNYEKILTNLKDKTEESIDDIRRILRSKMIDYHELYSYIYDHIDVFDDKAILLLNLGEASRAHDYTSLPEINFMTFVIKTALGKI